MNNLICVTGASGTGKTSIIPHLKKLLPKNYKIYDFDEIWKPYDFTNTWEGKVIEQCLNTYTKNKTNNFSTVIVGLIRPWKVVDKFEDNPYFIHLDVTELEREKRLKKRKANINLMQDLEELDELRKWFRNTNFRSINTTNISIKEVAKMVSKIISHQDQLP